jgi:hypothetical protein
MYENKISIPDLQFETGINKTAGRPIREEYIIAILIKRRAT